jgi:MFS transporter, SHS family, sialic acid transporter
MFVPESAKWQHAVESGPRPRLAEIFAPALIRRTLVATLLSGIAVVGTWGSVQWIPIWTLSSTGSQALASDVQISCSLGAALGALLGAGAGKYFGRREVYFVLCLGSLLICGYLFRIHPKPSEGVDFLFLVVVFLTGGFTASFYGWLPLYLPEMFPTRMRATGEGFGFNFGRIIAAAGALNKDWRPPPWPVAESLQRGSGAGRYPERGDVRPAQAGSSIRWDDHNPGMHS